MPILGSRPGRTLLVLAGLAAAATGVAAAVFYVAFLRDLPDLRSLRDYRPLLATHVYDREGRPIGEFYQERRFLVDPETLPRHVVLAFVAAEDDSFYQHSGLDYRAILRAAWANLMAGGEIRQGGSTITQQVAKSLLLSPERRYTRKIKDMLLARRIEQHFTKDEILYLYLNQIYFGDGAYGIGEAARSYYGIGPEELSVAQAAQLAGLPKAPSAYSPYRSPEAAERRRQYVLRRMFEEGYIDESAYEQARETIPPLAPPPEREGARLAAYFTEEVRRLLFDQLGGDLVLRGGLRVETTLDLDDQRAAVSALRSGLQALDHRQGWRGPLRRVAPDAFGDTLAALAKENGLAAGADTGSPPAPLRLAGEGPWVGLVTAVDPGAKTARVAFAPDLSGEVALEDVAWARDPNPKRRSRPVRRIQDIFDAGMVVRFGPVASATDKAAGASAGADAGADGPAVPRLTLYQAPQVQGALLAMDIGSGDVLALVGGYDFERSEFDRVTQARRQPGSAFKPIIYATAITRGYTPASIVVDRPLVYDDPESGFTWRPENYGRRFLGRLTLREALARSVNNATIHLLKDVGVGPVIELATRLGIRSPLEHNLSLALGSSGVSLLELTRAYATFPSGGRLVQPVFIRRVLDRDGNVLLENVPLGDTVAEKEEGTDVEKPDLQPAAASGEPALPPGHVMKPVDAFLVTDMLEGVVQRGTGRQARALGRPLGGKTGTTNEQGDAWFVGFSPDIAVGTWVGFDEKRVLGVGETGGHAALPIWIDFMRSALEGQPVRDFPVPDGIVFARVDRATGKLPAPGAKDTYFQAFAVGTEPTEPDDGAVTATDGDRLLRLDAF